MKRKYQGKIFLKHVISILKNFLTISTLNLSIFQVHIFKTHMASHSSMFQTEIFITFHAAVFRHSGNPPGPSQLARVAAFPFIMC